jgi:multiple sugar transport system permease protein
VAFPITIDYFGVMTMIQYLWNIFGSAAILLLLYGTAPPLSTTTLSWLVYQKAFVQSDIGYSQAVGVVLFFAGLIGILIIRRVFRPRF